MLQQILKDMFVEPDLLSELSEEQKQTLFCKMREEQVRSWQEREALLEKKEKKKSSKKKQQSSKKVQFLLGADGNEWVWVIEHSGEDSIVEDETLEQQHQEEEIHQKPLEILPPSENTTKANGIMPPPDTCVQPKQKSEDVDQSSDEHERAWRESEARAKDHERATREVVRRVREHLRQNSNGPEDPPPLPARRKPGAVPPRPKSREQAIEWFRKSEKPRGATVSDGAVAAWFHGGIDRNEAERLLQNKPPGSFLIRLSEKIFGYAVSVMGDDRCKHFLIEVSSTGYHFFGAASTVHSSLFQLIQHHKKSPISLSGGELLLGAVGQARNPPDYSELFDDDEVTHL